MPRASAAGKRQQGAANTNNNNNSRDSRHEPGHGLVAPGRSVARKKSQGQLDAHPRPVHSHASSAAPSSRRDTGPSHVNGHATTNGTNGSAQPNGNGDARSRAHSNANSHLYTCAPGLDNKHTHLLRRSSLDAHSESSSSMADSVHSSSAGPQPSSHHLAAPEPSHRQIDVNATKTADVHRDSGPVEFAATVLRALPLYDTLAILIILMQLPPITLSGIYILFACLTFVPPAHGGSGSGLYLQFADVLDWSANMPSLLTVFCIDFLTFLFWLFLWPSVQNAILDLAKPVIAATLGGGATTREGTVRGGVSACFLFMLTTHVVKNNRRHWVRLVRLLPTSWRQVLDPKDPFRSALAAGSQDRRFPFTWLTTILSIHIVIQGLVRYIREWYIRRERIHNAAAHGGGAGSTASTTTASISDAERSPPPPAAPVDVTAPDGTVHAAEVAAEPALPSAPAPAPSHKRRRKESAQVRLQQPLWSALASTKIVVIKEFELTRTSAETLGSNATDIHNLGNAPFDLEPGRIWISYIGSDDVCFNSSFFHDPIECNDAPADAPPRPAGADPTKPFYVRVNNAYWPSTRILPFHDGPEEAEEVRRSQGGSRWTGDIYGLRPMSRYLCEFVDTCTGEVIFHAAITTTQEPSRETDSPTIAAVADAPRRPDSPATTLRTSIAAAEAKLADERNRLRTLRKEWKSKTNALRKENENTEHAIQSSGGTDDRYRQKIRQQETQKAQAEKETTELEETLRVFDPSPAWLLDRKKEGEKDFSGEKGHFDDAQKEFKEFRASIKTEVEAKEAEKQQLQARRNKVATRVARVDAELANITDANRKGLNEAERRKQEREAWQRQVIAREAWLVDHLKALRTTNGMKQDHITTAIQQVGTLQEQVNYSNGAVAAAAAAAAAAASAATAGASGSPGMVSAGLDGDHGVGMPGLHAQYAPGVSTSSAWPTLPTSTMPPLSEHMTASTYGSQPLPSSNMWSNEAASASPWFSPATTGASLAQGFVVPPPVTRTRGRSSSMLSNVSGFTQSSSSDDVGARLRAGVFKAPKGLGSGSSGSVSSSPRHPMSPV